MLSVVQSNALLGNYRVAEVLIQNGANVNSVNTMRHDQTPLHLASLKGHLNLVKLLVEKGADVNMHNVNPRGPTR